MLFSAYQLAPDLVDPAIEVVVLEPNDHVLSAELVQL